MDERIITVRERPTVAVCFTVRQCEAETRQLISDLLAQDWQDFLISAVDAFSTDGTYAALTEAAERHPTRLRVEQRAGNISTGRNAAVRASRADIIVTTDAGVRLRPDWVRRMSEPLLNGSAKFTRARYEPPETVKGWHAAISSAITPTYDEFVADNVLPSARGACFRMSDFEACGGFPEDLDHTEDVVFFKQLRNRVGAAHMVNDPPLIWDARADLRSYAHQYRRYARGDAMAGIYVRRNLGRPAFYLATLAAACRGRAGIVFSLLAWSALLLRPMTRLSRHASTSPWPLSHRLGAALVIQAVGDWSKVTGYVQGQIEMRSRSKGT